MKKMTKSLNYLYGLIYLFVVLIIFIYGIIKLNNKNFFIEDVRMWSSIGLLLFMVGIGVWVLIEKDIFSPWIIFFSLAYMYWFGQSTLYVFDVLPNLAEFNTYSIDSLCNALIYQCIGFSLMHMGALFVRCRKSNIYQRRIAVVKFENKELKNSINKVALVMFCASSPFVFIDLFQKMIISITSGYLALYESGARTSVSNLAEVLSMFFVPSLFLLLAANKDSKKKRILIVSTMLVYIGGFLMSGGRSVAMGLGMCLILFYHRQIKPYKKTRVIQLIIVGVIVLIMIPVVGEVRGLENRSIDEIMNVIRKILTEENVFITTLNSMGFSIFPMVKTMEIIPKIQGFSYGFEYICTVLAVIPSIFFLGYSFASIAALPDWLKNTLNMDYGPGYSIIAESYYNFGWGGLITMFITGIAIQKVFTNKRNGSYHILYDAIICIILYFLSLVIRNSILLFFRNILYGIIIPLIIIRLITKKERRSK